ncbi:MAG: hypothetical protein Q8J70_02660 [Thiobacillus sp.]|nr:hypothetical protein [Thiobacillus sp.]
MMILYRIMVRTSLSGGMFMDATGSFELAVKEAQLIQSENPSYKVTIEAESWPTLTKLKYHWYLLTRQAEGFGVEFQSDHGHKHSGSKTVWPQAQSSAPADGRPAGSALD